MHDRHGIAEAAAEAPYCLRGQRDLGHEHARRATPRKDPLDSLQIHLGLARARDAVDEHHVAVGGIAGGGDGVERLRLARGELRLARGSMRCVFVAHRQVGIVGAQPARMTFAGGSEAGGSPLDDAPASGLPEADRLFAGRIPSRTRNRALRDARRVFGKPAHAAAVLDDHRALRLQGLKRRGNRAQLSGQLADAQLPAAQRLHDRDLFDGVRAGCELGKRRAGDHPAIVDLADRGLFEAPTAIAPVHHARHAARRREQVHTRRQRRNVALGQPLGAGGALFIEIRLADGALNGLELARVDALRPLRPAGLPIFADRHHEAHGAPVTERHQHSAAH